MTLKMHSKTVTTFLILIFTALIFPQLAQAQLRPGYQRNGEVYLYIGVDSQPQARGVWRLNDPEGVQAAGQFFPQIIPNVGDREILNYTVDINRNIFTLSDPVETPIGDNYMLKRQVLDYSQRLKPDKSWKHDSRPGTLDTGNVTETMSDWGAHQFIHVDRRYRYNWGLGGDFYRTAPNNNQGRGIRTAYPTRGVLYRAGTSPASTDSIPGKPRYYKNNFVTTISCCGITTTGFNAKQGAPTDPPTNPVDYLPSGFSNKQLILPHYQGKKWYLIPNGAWFSSWKARDCDYSGKLRVKDWNLKIPPYYYQTFADRASGSEFEWRLIRWDPTNPRANSYSDNPQAPFATTYQMTVARATLAGCLDGCGGSSGTGATDVTEMEFSAAFMPFADAGGNPDVRAYAYSRPKGKSNYTLESSGGANSYIPIGDPVGVGTADTEWIGVSMASRNTDYLYYMGNSVIRNWINNPTLDIKAVTVSNQWNQEGGIIFAFDASNNSIRRIIVDEDDNATFDTINISGILNSITADPASTIDDIAADGFGNLFLSLTYPSSNPNFNVPEAYGWDNNDIIDYEYSVAGPGEAGTHRPGELRFPEVIYRKSVWRISALGQPPEEVGNVEIARRTYTRHTSMIDAGWLQLPAVDDLPGNAKAIIASWTENDPAAFVGPFEGTHVNLTGAGSSKIAVINAPTPPKVLSLHDKNSYLDIIGPYPDGNPPIPLYDITNRTTNQNHPDFPRGDSNNLELGKLYFYMVENYPIPGAAQDPRVNPDFDNDGRVGGFISTIINTDPDVKDNPRIRYVWNTWFVRRGSRGKEGPAIIPPVSTNPDEDATTYFTAVYAPIPGHYILTCKVEYDWYDYDQMDFGTTIDDWEENPVVFTDFAIPSAASPDASGNPRAEWAPTRLENILRNNAFADYTTEGHLNYDPTALDSIVTDLSTTILGGSNVYAIEHIFAEGEIRIPTDTTEIARLQRCNPGTAVAPGAPELVNNPNNNSHWYPTTGMAPTEGYHGISAGETYSWRIDVASQAVFFDDLSTKSGLPDYSSSPNHSMYTYYNFLADKLEDPQQSGYYVGGNDNFRFDRRGDDIRWQPNSHVAISAYLEYPRPTPTGIETVRYDVPRSDVLTAPSTVATYAYITIPSSLLPPTDPFVATLTIEINRGFFYDMYLYDKEGQLWTNSPNPMPKFLTVTAQTNIMVIDTEAPVIVYSQTQPRQIFGNTGEALRAGTNGNPENLCFSLEDNNPWEGVGVAPHAHYLSANVEHNTDTIAKLSKPGSANTNLKPVFNNNKRFVEFSYDIATMIHTPPSRKISITRNNYAPGWGRKDAAILENLGMSVELAGLTAPTIAFVADISMGEFSSTFDFSQPINEISHNGSALTLPPNYANNSPGYYESGGGPYRFYIEAMDSSGNHLQRTELNLVLHVRDNIPPAPYGMITEMKGNTTTRFPAVSAISEVDDEDWFSAYIGLTSFSKEYIDRKDSWTANDQGEIPIGTHNLLSLPYVSSQIVQINDETFEANVLGSSPPGNFVVEDNVEVLMTVGASDNVGVAFASMTYSVFDIEGNASQLTFSPNLDNEEGLSWKPQGLGSDNPEVSKGFRRAIFRESTDIPFPIGIPIVIKAHDDAREWDSYDAGEHTANSFSWGPLQPGALSPNTRTYTTTLPVYGSELLIRTIDRGLRPRN